MNHPYKEPGKVLADRELIVPKPFNPKQARKIIKGRRHILLKKKEFLQKAKQDSKKELAEELKKAKVKAKRTWNEEIEPKLKKATKAFDYKIKVFISTCEPRRSAIIDYGKSLGWSVTKKEDSGNIIISWGWWNRFRFAVYFVILLAPTIYISILYI